MNYSLTGQSLVIWSLSVSRLSVSRSYHPPIFLDRSSRAAVYALILVSSGGLISVLRLDLDAAFLSNCRSRRRPLSGLFGLFNCPNGLLLPVMIGTLLNHGFTELYK